MGDQPVPLTRLTDATRIANNRDTSCAGFVRTPPGSDDSCDEYPYASTYQGAGIIGLSRTAVGHVPLNQNTRGGTKLSSFYLANRVLDGDPFWVDVVDGFGEAGPGRDRPPTVDAGGNVYGPEGSDVTLSGQADDDTGPPALTWTYQPDPTVDAGAMCTFGNPHAAQTTLACTDDGPFVVTLTADDGVNEPVSSSATAYVNNVEPHFLSSNPHVVQPHTAGSTMGPARWSLYRVGTVVPVTAPYHDPGSNDTQTCVVNWDDGTVDNYNAHDSTCDRTHMYRHAGMYTITLTVTDDDGGSESWSTMVVVYDPAAGIGQGNGWLNAGGDGGFNFTASYPTRASTVPDGAVTFALPPALNLNLRNHQHLDWLVVTPDGKIAIKGTAERIPGQNVGFVLYGYYGCPAGQNEGCQPGPHRLRIVVWDSSAYGPVPDGIPINYDNRAGTSFDVDAANPQAINAGTILIQHPPIQ